MLCYVKVQTPGTRQARPCLPLLPPVTPQAPGQAKAGTTVRLFFTGPRLVLPGSRRMVEGGNPSVGDSTEPSHFRLPQ